VETSLSLSVVIPAWNNSHFLPEAIVSALSCADEVIVVDDASSDGTVELGYAPFREDSRVGFLKLGSNRGPSGARVAGLEKSSGELIGFLDADDRYAPNALERLRSRLQENPSADIALGRKTGLYLQDERTYAVQGDVVRMYSFGSALIRRELLTRVNIDTQIRHGEDIDWFMRIQEDQAQFELVDEVTQHYRRHAHNLTAIEEGDAKSADLADVMMRSMLRRRKLAKQRGVSVKDIYYVQPDNFSDS